jgi:hypothetical protein
MSVMRRAVVAALAIAAALIAWNATVAVPAMRALADEEDASVAVYRRWLISPSEIVFDVRSVESTATMAIIDRMLFKTAEALKGRSYDGVVLASAGTARFVLEGARFRVIGEERSFQNPIYVIRTLQEHVRNLDGSQAFGHWEGGWLGVVGKQLEDHNELHMRWWIRPLL